MNLLSHGPAFPKGEYLISAIRFFLSIFGRGAIIDK